MEAGSPATEDRRIPLCVDLDGTLIRSDLLWEGAVVALKRRPWIALLFPLWLLRGRAHLKRRIAQSALVSPDTLPYRQEVLEFCRQERDRGRRLVLVTAADEGPARAVASHLDLFDEVLASDGRRNLSGTSKRDELAGRFGPRGFDYAGDSRKDLAVWADSREAIVVAPGPGLEKAARDTARVGRVFHPEGSRLLAFLRALRPYQWAKNLLVFVPVTAAHQVTDPAQLRAALLAFVAFSLCASAVYLLNDLLDLEADRNHPRKKGRPFASGALSIPFGLVMVPLLLALAVAASIPLRPLFLAVLAVYFAVTLAYSLGLKELAIVDVLTLAGLYTLRILAGAAATWVPPSFWLLAFSMFIFLSLALVKRNAELRVMFAKGRAGARGYRVEDLPVLQALGAASGCLSVLVLALYVNSGTVENLYRRPEAIWLLCPLLLYWIARIWLKTHRGLMHDDPVIFAMSDRVSQILLVVAGLIMWAAL
jgi:4-hydroxybenzoate polyprenyltransferase/phosphoserine phosphatase